jgi:hypothetical protein
MRAINRAKIIPGIAIQVKTGFHGFSIRDGKGDQNRKNYCSNAVNMKAPAEILWPSTKVAHAKIMNRVQELVQRVAEAGPETTQPHLYFDLKFK